jgi:hypothetical protein
MTGSEQIVAENTPTMLPTIQGVALPGDSSINGDGQRYVYTFTKYHGASGDLRSQRYSYRKARLNRKLSIGRVPGSCAT